MSDRGRSFVVQIDFPGEAAFDAGEAISDPDRPATENPWLGTQFNARPVAPADQRVFAFNFDGRQHVITAQSEPDSPGDVYLLDVDGASARSTRLTRVNGSLLGARLVSVPEPVAFEGSLGRRIEGWLLPPTNGAPAPYPLVLHVHGGPHSAYSPAFNFELQQLAADGYAVLYLNPHGSQTYGLEIARGTQLDWGGKDFDDLMLGVDHALTRPDVDGERLGVAGGSYGGWMTNYIVAHTTRFKGAVAQRSSSNRISTMLSSAEGYRHARWEAPGYPWDHLDYFVRISPVFRAAYVETPLLLLHEEEDHLCPLMQAEEMFTALKCLNRTVELVVFLGESHYMLRLGKPANRVERLLRTTDWFGRYV
jgi:dipeptidyl aminopeptidase/acylaminoacyl peptidase